MGRMWRVISRCSRVFELGIDEMKVGSGPRWVIRSIKRVYEAVRSVARPVRMIVNGDQLKSATMIVSSAIKLVVGGSAIFVRLASSHHVPMRGRRGCRPRARSRMRLCVRS